MKGKSKKGSSAGSGSNKSSLNVTPNQSTLSLKDQNGATIKDKVNHDDDTELNSGFGDYLRSAEGVEMMKLFVIANSVVIILTMAWPNMKELYKMCEEWWYYQNI